MMLYPMLVLMMAGVLGESVDRDCMERLRREGPPAWSAASGTLDDIDVDCAEEDTTRKLAGFKGEVREPSVSHWRFTQDSRHSRRLIEEKGTAASTLRVVNPNYAFVVHQMKGKAEYELGDCRRVDRKDFTDPDIHEVMALFSVSAGFQLYSVPLAEIITSGDFQPVKLNCTDHNTIYMEYKYNGKTEQPRQHGAIYWAELDPDNHWMIVRGGIRDEIEGGGRKQVVSYQATVSGIPFPKTVQLSDTVPKAGLELQSRYEFSSPSRAKRPDSDFRLTAYGIPESVLGISPDRRWMVRGGLIIINLLVLLILAVILWRRKVLRSD